MNADAITKQIMEAIDEAASFDDKQARQHAEYAISRAVGSIISGLSCDCRSEREHYVKRQTGVQPDGFADDAKYDALDNVPCRGHCLILKSSKKHVCHWPNCASAELANEKIFALTEALRDLWRWTQDADRGPFVPDGLGAQILQVLNEPKLVDKPHDNHVPTDLRRELMKLAQETGLSYYYFCGLYQRGLTDGQAGIPVL